MRRSQFTAPALLIIANILFASEFLAMKWTVDAVGSLLLPFWEHLLAGIVILPLFYRQPGRSHSLWRLGKVICERKHRLPFLGAMLCAMATGPTLAWGIAHAGAADAAILGLSIPIFASVLGWIALQEKMTVARWTSYAVAITGAAIISEPRLMGFRGLRLEHAAGDFVILVSCVSSAAYSAISKRLLHSFTTPEVLLPTWIGSAGMLALGITLMRPGLWATIPGYQLNTWLGLITVGVFSKGLAMAFFLFALSQVELGQAALSLYLSPLFGVLMAVLLGHESLTWPMVCGGGLVFLGNALVTPQWGRNKTVSAAPGNAGRSGL